MLKIWDYFSTQLFGLGWLVLYCIILYWFPCIPFGSLYFLFCNIAFNYISLVAIIMLNVSVVLYFLLCVAQAGRFRSMWREHFYVTLTSNVHWANRIFRPTSHKRAHVYLTKFFLNYTKMAMLSIMIDVGKSKIITVKKLPSVGIEHGTSCDQLWCLPD